MQDAIFRPRFRSEAIFPMLKCRFKMKAKNRLITRFKEDSLALTTPA